jgi:integrase
LTFKIARRRTGSVCPGARIAARGGRPDDLARILTKAKAEQDERRLGLGQDWRDLGLVVDNGDGSPVHPERLTRYFGRLVRRLGVTMREHDLRHAYISELLSRGVSPLAVSRIAGHAKAGFTMDRYGHVLPRDFDAVRAALSVGGVR